MSARTLTIETAAVFEPLLHPARYKGAHGGRGSGKSHFFAEKMIDDSLYEKGLASVCIREVQKSLKDSAKRLLENKIIDLRLTEADGFKVFTDKIQTPGDGVIIFQGMQDHTAESIKSLEGFKRAWIEEAQTLSARSFELLRPTIRADGSEIWSSWNPRRKSDVIDKVLRGATPPTGSIIVRANWSDNPWFPKVLEQERLDCVRDNPDQYQHVWEGDYATVLEGAYYARDITRAKLEHRIGFVAADPLLRLRIFCDLGGTGAKADAFVMWIVQFIGSEIRFLDYYEAQGQPLAAHVAWLHSKGYTHYRADVWLPHDGTTKDRVYDASFESGFRQAGYAVVTVKNQGAGAARLRVESARRVFPSMRFNVETCQPGLDALGWYHEKRDPDRGIGLGPEHDWSSHCADAFGLVCVVWEIPLVEGDNDDNDDSARTRSATTGY